MLEQAKAAAAGGPPPKQQQQQQQQQQQYPTATTEGPFGLTMHDFLPPDMSSARATPESSIGTPGSSQARLAESVFQSPGRGGAAPTAQMGGGAGNPLQRLNSLMFPTNDPFAYPMQPVMELGFMPPPQQQPQQQRQQSKGQQQQQPGMMPPQHIDASQLYIPPGFDGFFGDMGQGQPQQQQQGRQQQAGMNLRQMFEPAMIGINHPLPQQNGDGYPSQQQLKMDGSGPGQVQGQPARDSVLDMGPDEWARMWSFQDM
jgi:hypothetical protein